MTLKRMPLLVRMPNWVGDACMAIPALDALGQAGFDCQLLGKGWLASLMAGLDLPCIKLEGRQAVTQLRALGIARGLLLTNSLSSALACRRAGIETIGYAAELRSPLLTQAITKPTGKHEAQYFHALARHAEQLWLGRDSLPRETPADITLPLTPQARHQADAALAAAELSADTYLVLCPLAVGTIAGASKVWPQWRELGDHLSKLGLRSVCCPGPGEADACRKALPNAVQLPDLDLGAYVAVMQQARLVIANDSGPMHLASCTSTPVLGIFGPGDPGRTAPWSSHGEHLGGFGAWPDLDAVRTRAATLLNATQR